ncbi:MAG: mechanosensitive ion channel family protein [Bacteroidia bacterium]
MESEAEKYIFNPELDKLVYLLIGIAVVWFVVKATQKFLFSKIKDNGNHYRAKKLSGFIGYLLIILLLVFIYGDKLGRISVALGVASAGIAFALQEVIASVAGWVAIMLGGFYKTGDRIQLGGVKGDVMDIGVTRTTIMEIGQWVDGDMYNGRIVFIANSFIFKEPVFNYSGDMTILWDEIKIPIQYGSNYEKAKQMFLNIGKEVAGEMSHKPREQWNKLQNKYRLEDAQTEPMVSIIINESWVQFTLRYVVHYKKRRLIKTELFARVLKEIDATKGEIKIAQVPLTSGDSGQLKN